MKQTHTPGPWRLIPHVNNGKTLIATQRGKHLFYIEEAPGLGREAEPNAHLLVAAPELLQALKRIVDASYSEQIDAILAAMPVIAKAEGVRQ